MSSLIYQVLVPEPVSHQARGPSLVILKISVTRKKYKRSYLRIRGRRMQPYTRNASRKLEMVEVEIAVILLIFIS